MAAPSSTTNPPTSSASRWVGSGESGSAFGRGRGRGNGGRGGRGGRGGGPSRESKADPESRTDKPKPVLAKVPTNSTPSDSNEHAPSTPRTKNPSRRPARSTPAPIVTQLSTPSAEPQSPSSASRPNRRKRSQTSKAPSLSSRIKVVPGHTLVRPDEPTLPPVPHTAPLARDAPPHLSNNHHPAEMKSNIDALVERVRAVAMADNRPSTPGSHIDWAGDDDDSLPDLNDWGISTITTAQTISPIIVDGLKPLPEPFAKPMSSAISPVKVSSPLASLPHGRSQEKRKQTKESGIHETAKTGNNNWRSPLPPRPTSAPNAAPPNRRSGATPTSTTPPFNSTSFVEEKGDGKRPPASVATESPQEEATPGIKIIDKTPTVTDGAETTVASPGADSIDASTSAHHALFDGFGNESGLSASIHAPRSIFDSASAPATISTYNNLPRPPHSDSYTHSRRPASFNSNPRNPRSNNSTPQGHNQHVRNHSSPQTASPDGGHKSPHARPVITGAAISRLARTIVSTAPKSAPAISTSTE